MRSAARACRELSTNYTPLIPYYSPAPPTDTSEATTSAIPRVKATLLTILPMPTPAVSRDCKVVETISIRSVGATGKVLSSAHRRPGSNFESRVQGSQFRSRTHLSKSTTCEPSDPYLLFPSPMGLLLSAPYQRKTVLL